MIRFICWFVVSIYNNPGKAARDFNFKTWKIITVYSLLTFLRLDLVCIKCNQFIHPAKDKEYKILLKLCKGDFSVPVVDRSKLQKSTIIKFWRNRERFYQNKNVLFYDDKKVLCLLFLLFYWYWSLVIIKYNARNLSVANRRGVKD